MAPEVIQVAPGAVYDGKYKFNKNKHKFFFPSSHTFLYFLPTRQGGRRVVLRRHAVRTGERGHQRGDGEESAGDAAVDLLAFKWTVSCHPFAAP